MYKEGEKLTMNAHKKSNVWPFMVDVIGAVIVAGIILIVANIILGWN